MRLWFELPPVVQPVGAAALNCILGPTNVLLNWLNVRFVTGSTVSAQAAPAAPSEIPIAASAIEVDLRDDTIICWLLVTRLAVAQPSIALLFRSRNTCNIDANHKLFDITMACGFRATSPRRSP